MLRQQIVVIFNDHQPSGTSWYSLAFENVHNVLTIPRGEHVYCVDIFKLDNIEVADDALAEHPIQES